MTSALVAVVLIAFCGTVGVLGFFAHMCVCLLQKELECMEAVAVRQKKKTERINRAIRMVETAGDEAGETPTESAASEDALDGC